MQVLYLPRSRLSPNGPTLIAYRGPTIPADPELEQLGSTLPLRHPHVQPPGLLFSKPVLHIPPMFQCPHHPSRTGVLVEQGHVSVYTAVGVSDGLSIWSDTSAPVSNFRGDPRS